MLLSNVRAIACYRKCGLMKEGREREAALVNGACQDDICNSPKTENPA